MGKILDLRLLKCMDGLHYTFSILNLNYSELHTTCALIQTDSAAFIRALAQCWSIIDAVNRLREIAQAIPGLNKGDRALSNFLRTTRIAERYRNYIQHLRQELLKKDLDPFPVWGTLSWINPTDGSESFTAITGMQLPNVQYPGCIYDTAEKRWLSKVMLTIGDEAFNFDAIYAAAEQFNAYIQSWITSNSAYSVSLRSEIPIMSFRLELKNGNTRNVEIDYQKR